MSSKNSIIAVLVVLLLAAAAGFWYWSNKKKAEVSLPSPAELQENVGGGLGANIYEKSQNPIADKLPETNPFGKVPINPLKSIYSNPFE